MTACLRSDVFTRDHAVYKACVTNHSSQTSFCPEAPANCQSTSSHAPEITITATLLMSNLSQTIFTARRTCTARYMLWPGVSVLPSVTRQYCISTAVLITHHAMNVTCSL